MPEPILIEISIPVLDKFISLKNLSGSNCRILSGVAVFGVFSELFRVPGALVVLFRDGVPSLLRLLFLEVST